MLRLQSHTPDRSPGSLVRPPLDAMPAALTCAPASCTRLVQAAAVRRSPTLSAVPATVQRTHSFCSTVRPPKPTTAATATRASVATAAAAAAAAPATMAQVRRGCLQSINSSLTATSPTPQQPFIIVGGGRVGQALADMGSGTDVLVRRGEPVSGPAGPIVVCTRNDDLQAVVDATPPERRQGKLPCFAAAAATAAVCCLRRCNLRQFGTGGQAHCAVREATTRR